MTLLLGLVLAGLSALVTQVGFLLRQRGAVAAPDVELRHPLRSAIALFRSKWWTIGYALAIVAYVLHVGALTLAAMSLVQAVLAGGLVVLAVVAERFFGFELERRQWIGLLLTSLGLAMLAITGEARSGQESANYSVVAMLAFEAAIAAIGVALVVSCNRGRSKSHHGILLGLAAGLLFTTTHVAVKALSGKVDTGLAEVLLSPYLYIALAGGVVAFFASARSLQIGPGGAGDRGHRNRRERLRDTGRHHRLRRPARERRAHRGGPDGGLHARGGRRRADPRARATQSPRFTAPRTFSCSFHEAWGT